MKYGILLVIWLNTFNAASALATELTVKPQLAKSYRQEKINISDYWVSEKLDGIRGIWTGSKLYTRQGNEILAPAWFTEHWPNMAMDGELWIARNKFEQVLSCVSSIHDNNNCWREISYMVFDLPNQPDSFTMRIKTIKKELNNTESAYLKMVEQKQLATIEELQQLLNTTVALGGEGLMLHRGSARYTQGRTDNLLKVKKYLIQTHRQPHGRLIQLYACAIIWLAIMA